MLVSLGLFLLISLVSLISLPFWKHFSYETLCWIRDFYKWSFPIILGLFVVSSGVFVSNFKYHIKWDIKPEEQEGE